MSRSLKNSPQLVGRECSPKTPVRQELKTYKRRYLVCIIFAFNSIANAMVWITFAPIQTTAAEYFNVSQSAVNLFSMSFMIAYVPGSLMCAWMFNKYYLRKSFIFCSGFQTIGTILRYIATLHFITSNSFSKYLSYIIVLIGQTMVALCQPYYTNSPARIPAEWFSKDGRDVVTAILSIVNPLGIGLGSVIPTLFVSVDGYHWNGFKGLMLLELITTSIGFILTLLFFYDKPPTAPSLSQKLKQSSSGMQRSLKYDLTQILKNKQFFFIFVGFGIGLGLFNALTTLINQYTAAFGYSTDDAGNFGGLLIGGGLIGAVVAGICMEVFRAYRTILKTFTFFTCVIMLFLLWQLKPHNLSVVTMVFGIFGFMAIPIVAVTFECAAECTYPANEELGSALLMTSGSIFGIAYILIWGSLLPDTNNGHTYKNAWNFSSYFLVINGFIMLIFMVLFNGKYKRLQAEDEFSKYIEDLNEEDISVIESDTRDTWNKDTWNNEKQIQNNNNNNNNNNNDDISVNSQINENNNIDTPKEEENNNNNDDDISVASENSQTNENNIETPKEEENNDKDIDKEDNDNNNNNNNTENENEIEEESLQPSTDKIEDKIEDKMEDKIQNTNDENQNENVESPKEEDNKDNNHDDDNDDDNDDVSVDSNVSGNSESNTNDNDDNDNDNDNIEEEQIVNDKIQDINHENENIESQKEDNNNNDDNDNDNDNMEEEQIVNDKIQDINHENENIESQKEDNNNNDDNDNDNDN
eukprot:194979_1